MNEWRRMTTLDLEGRVEVRSINVVLKLKIVLERNVAFWNSSSSPAVPSLLRQFDSTFNATFWFRSTSPHCSLSLTQLQLLFLVNSISIFEEEEQNKKNSVLYYYYYYKSHNKILGEEREREVSMQWGWDIITTTENSQIKKNWLKFFFFNLICGVHDERRAILNGFLIWWL